MDPYKNAKKLQKYIVYQGTSRDTDFFEFKFNEEDTEKDIMVHLDKYCPGVKFSCTCKYHSVKNINMDRMCIFVLAVLHFMVNKNEKD